MEKDTLNRFMVAMNGHGEVVIGNPTLGTGRCVYAREQAASLAAWLLVMSGVSREDFLALVDAIERT